MDMEGTKEMAVMNGWNERCLKGGMDMEEDRWQSRKAGKGTC